MSKEVKGKSVKREPFVQSAVVQLFKKRDAPYSDAKAVIVRPLKDDESGATDYGAVAVLVWKTDLVALLEGRLSQVKAFSVPPRPLNGD